MKGFLWDVSPSARVTVVQVTFKEKFFNIIVGGNLPDESILSGKAFIPIHVPCKFIFRRQLQVFESIVAIFTPMRAMTHGYIKWSICY